MLCFSWLEKACPGHSRLWFWAPHGPACSGRACVCVCNWSFALPSGVCTKSCCALCGWREGVLAEEQGGPCSEAVGCSWGQPARPCPDAPFLTCLLLFCSRPGPGVVPGTHCPSLIGRDGVWGEGTGTRDPEFQSPPAAAAELTSPCFLFLIFKMQIMLLFHSHWKSLRDHLVT